MLLEEMDICLRTILTEGESIAESALRYTDSSGPHTLNGGHATSIDGLALTE